MNRVCEVGRLTRDPQVFSTENGTTVKATMAVNRPFAKEGGQEADFIPLIAFGKTAEFMEKYYKKGTLIEVDGKLISGSYVKDGQTIYTLEVLVGVTRSLEKIQKESDYFIPIPESDEVMPFK